MTDGAATSYAEWSAGYDPADPVDRAIRATRRAVFPAHGLDPDWP
jgi:acetoin utilization protein AcuC